MHSACDFVKDQAAVRPSFKYSKKGSDTFDLFGTRNSCFVKLVIHLLLFLLTTCDYKELYSKKYKLNGHADLYFLNIFKTSTNRFGSVSCFEKICGEFISGQTGHTKGVFKYDASTLQKTISNNESFICQYKFVAKPHEKVLINFNKFDVKSIAPDCINEYVDIYIELGENQIDNYAETNFLSRWCGWKKPNVLVSFKNVIIIAYHKDWLVRGSSFFGTFEFISADPYNWGRIENKPCEYEFNSQYTKTGVVTSPTYPGTYPNILNCKYKFYGLPTERISLYFEEIVIHYEAEHCPYDSIKIYDYQKISSSTSQKEKTALSRILIDTYCGKKNNLKIYSTNNLFEFEFDMADSLSNEQYSDVENQILLRKGFKVRYEFSEHYADLSFVTGSHVTGTNCDQRIRSKEQTGIIYSPNYFRPNPINVTCKYIFQGLDDLYNFESIKLNFLETNLKPATAKNICDEKKVSYFVIYDSLKDMKNKIKSSYCFVHLEKNELRSIDSEMVLEFHSVNSDLSYPSNFKANYTFFTEFGIMGTRIYQNRTCLFTYNSNSMAHGKVNSPRYPNNYPLNIKCVYIFDINQDERILFTFKEFRLPSFNDNCNPYEDNLSIHQSNSNLLSSTTNEMYQPNTIDKEWHFVSRFCGIKIPPPLITSPNQKQIKFTFYSDNVNYAQGFEFSYDYVTLPECIFNYYTTKNKTSGQILIANNIRATYYCDWYITTNPNKNILLHFVNKGLEDFKKNQFIINIYDLGSIVSESQYTQTSSNDLILKPPRYTYYLDHAVKSFTVNSSRIRIQLVVGKNMMLDKGMLTITWVAASNDLCKNDEYMCQKTGYCIKKDLYCDKIIHCIDGSDESDDCNSSRIKTERQEFPITEVFLLCALVVILIILISFCVHCRIQSKKSKLLLKNSSSPYQYKNGTPSFYRYSPAESVDVLEAAITSV